MAKQLKVIISTSARKQAHLMCGVINIHQTHSYCSMFWLFTSWT